MREFEIISEHHVHENVYCYKVKVTKGEVENGRINRESYLNYKSWDNSILFCLIEKHDTYYTPYDTGYHYKQSDLMQCIQSIYSVSFFYDTLNCAIDDYKSDQLRKDSELVKRKLISQYMIPIQNIGIVTVQGMKLDKMKVTCFGIFNESKNKIFSVSKNEFIPYENSPNIEIDDDTFFEDAEEAIRKVILHLTSLRNIQPK